MACLEPRGESLRYSKQPYSLIPKGGEAFPPNPYDPDLNPYVALPTEVVDASGLIESGCAIARRSQSQFIITGRGGLPPSPSDPLSRDTIWTDLRSPNQQAQTLPSAAVATSPTNPKKVQLVEAQGWVMGPNGTVILTAEAPTATPQTPGLASPSCQSVGATDK